MIIEFIKDHSAGITKGTIKELDAKFSEKMISEGYAKESTIEDLEKFRKGLDQQAKQKLSELQTKQTEAVKAKETNSIGTKKKDCGCEEKEGKKIGECEECKKKKEAAAQKKTVVRKKRTTKKK